MKLLKDLSLSVVVVLGMVYLLPAIINIFGLLFGFDPQSEGCLGKKRRIDLVILPVYSYACKEDAGLLQPYAKYFVNYMSEEVGK